MTALAALLALAAAGWWCRPAARSGRLDAVPEPRVSPRRGRRWWWCAPAALGLVALGLLLGGHRGALLAAVLAVVALTVVRVVLSHARQRRARRARADVGQACAALASLVAAGRVPAEALRDVAGDWGVLAEGAETVALGGDPTQAWLLAAERPGYGGLAELARGWSVAIHTGAPLVALLDAVAESLRADADIRHTVEAELASSRATGRLLAGLPGVGLLLGFGFGGNPVAFLLDQPAGWGCALGGTALACGGVLWSERIADRAEAW